MGNGFHPVRRRRRHFPALLVVLLDARDLVEKLALQGRVALQVARDHRAEALEFALDALAHFLAAVREQDCLVALRHVVGGGQQPARAYPQRTADEKAE